MLIQRISKMTGKTHYREMPVSYEQLMAWHEGAFIQSVMPDLTADQREFIMTGTTPEEWNEAFGEDEPEAYVRCGICLLDLADCECF